MTTPTTPPVERDLSKMYPTGDINKTPTSVHIDELREKFVDAMWNYFGIEDKSEAEIVAVNEPVGKGVGEEDNWGQFN